MTRNEARVAVKSVTGSTGAKLEFEVFMALARVATENGKMEAARHFTFRAFEFADEAFA